MIHWRDRMNFMGPIGMLAGISLNFAYGTAGIAYVAVSTVDLEAAERVGRRVPGAINPSHPVSARLQRCRIRLVRFALPFDLSLVSLPGGLIFFGRLELLLERFSVTVAEDDVSGEDVSHERLELFGIKGFPTAQQITIEVAPKVPDFLLAKLILERGKAGAAFQTLVLRINSLAQGKVERIANVADVQ